MLKRHYTHVYQVLSEEPSLHSRGVDRWIGIAESWRGAAWGLMGELVWWREWRPGVGAPAKATKTATSPPLWRDIHREGGKQGQS